MNTCPVCTLPAPEDDLCSSCKSANMNIPALLNALSTTDSEAFPRRKPSYTRNLPARMPPGAFQARQREYNAIQRWRKHHQRIK